MKHKLLVLLLLISFAFSGSLIDGNSIDPLIQDSGWQLVERFDDGIRLYEKAINGTDLKAYRVETQTDINGELLLQAFENVENYETILPSARNITFDTIDKSKNVIKAYQHIDIPLITDRHYFYQLFKSNGEKEYSWWELTDTDLELSKQMLEKHNLTDDALKLRKGAGVYRVIDRDTDKIVHYSLYLDPEGRIPGFMANMVNKRGLINMFRDLLNYSKQNMDS